MIFSLWKHRRPSQIIACISSKIAAVWPVTYLPWNVFIFSCNVHRSNGNYKYSTDNFDSHTTQRFITWPSQCCKPFENDNKWLRYFKIGSRNSNRLENASHYIACNFDVSQDLWNTPSRVYSIAVCCWAIWK